MYFKLAIRNLKKNSLFTTVNIIGLSVGIASVMALSFSVYQYITTDSIFNDKKNMYYLKTVVPDGNEEMQTTYPLLGEVLKSCPEIEAATHAQGYNNPWLKYGEKEVQENTMYVDSGFFKVFTFPFKYGNAGNSFNNKYAVVISEKVSNQLFGKENPVGKIISADDSVKLTVAGVLQPVPINATVRADVILTTALLMNDNHFIQQADWYNEFAENFIRLKSGGNTNILESKINKIVAANYAEESKKTRIKVVSFLHMKEEAGPIVSVIIKGSAGAALFILLIIVFNLINLNAATMFCRAKEVGVRQMMGSGRKNIIFQFCVENGLIVFFSIITGSLLFNYVLLPHMNKFTGERYGESIVNIKNDYPFLLSFILIGVIVTIVAGSLPAWRLSLLKITDTVKGRLHSGGETFRLRNIFITLQFSIAIIFIGITLIFNRQLSYMKNVSVGFNKENVVVVNTDLSFKEPAAASARFESILNQLKANPYIKSVSTSPVIPTRYWNDFDDYIDPATNKEVNFRQENADAGYLKTFEIPLAQGRDFNDDIATTEKLSVIINRSGMKALGWTSITGKNLRPKNETRIYEVVGVMEDFNYQNTQRSIEPLIHRYNGKQSLKNNNYLSLNITSGHQKEVLQKLEEDFKTMPGRRQFKYQYMADLVNKQYTLLNGILSTTNFIAFLTILVAAMGMFGLISLVAKQKVKEIGVRKVLGASVPNIVAMLSKDFLKLVAIASIIALPLSWYTMKNWLNDFAYRIQIQWWMLLLTAVIALLIALVTVGFQSIKAALLNPVKSLKSE
jgi:putative ABC transport system permease protein